MRTRYASILALVLVLVGATALDRSTPSTVRACGPITLFPVFVPLDAPDQNDFLQGNLGVLQPAYARRYLLAAWRTLNGRPLTADEQQAFKGGARSGQFTVTPAADAWQSVRKSVGGISAAATVVQDTFLLPTYSYIVNCSDSALLTAARTLEARRLSLGAADPRFLEWVRAQDVVFSNCGRRRDEPAVIPDSMGSETSAAARADRDYQIAAAHFYAGHFADAEARFTAISHDTMSPWQPWGRFLAARAVIRQGTMGGSESKGDPDALRRAEQMLRAVLADPQLSATHGPARQLLEFLAMRTEPVAALAGAATALDKPESGDDFRRHLDTYEFLLNRGTYDARGFSELVDWVLTMKTVAPNDETADYATGRWRGSNSLAWLVAAIANATATTPNLQELLAAAASVDRQSPAYATLAFHRARLLLLSGRPADARSALNDAIATPRLPRASVNAFKMVRLATAGTLDDFLADAIREPIEEGLGNGAVDTREATIAGDAAVILNNRLPTKMLRLAASNKSLPPQTRRDLLLATFTRALLLRQISTVRSLVPDVAREVPSLATALQPIASATDDATLRDEGAILLVAHPGLRPFFATGRSRTDSLAVIDSLRDNWWCSFSSTDYPDTPYETLYWHPDAQPVSTPLFLTADDRRSAENEWEQLKELDTAPNEIGGRVLMWARAHPTDPRVPEMLYRVVRATRYGCGNDRTSRISKDAFVLLHRQYPSSPWAAKTPYWY